MPSEGDWGASLKEGATKYRRLVDEIESSVLDSRGFIPNHPGSYELSRLLSMLRIAAASLEDAYDMSVKLSW